MNFTFLCLPKVGGSLIFIALSPPARLRSFPYLPPPPPEGLGNEWEERGGAEFIPPSARNSFSGKGEASLKPKRWALRHAVGKILYSGFKSFLCLILLIK
uniref:Uncharacterized protein n=1 Tax=Morchella importuna TaxID=1174673 RepID=A0A650AF80_9PEZI|nr:hypothetical protein [Morchella importuna]QGN66682.1 hypothetical protein [Morchella importuna]